MIVDISSIKDLTNGLLVRVGIDSTDGHWNAPMRLASGEFAYVSITESKVLRDGLERYYNEFLPVIKRFGQELPERLRGQLTHLDPDFDWLTYGDQGQRGRRIEKLGAGDLLAFYAAFQPVDDSPRPLVYALIGLYVIDEIVSALSVPQSRWGENAHTRRLPTENDIVVRARPEVSGRLQRCLPIGELRGGMYRVKNDLLSAWGGLDIKDGYIQRSVRLPAFRDAKRFYRWFLEQGSELVAANNPGT